MELEARQTDFAKALQRCIDLGCGRTEDRHGRAKAWEHGELAAAIKLSDRRMIYAYLNEREYPSEARFAYLLDAFSAKSDEQLAEVENLKVAFDKRPKKRRSETSRKTKPAAPLPPIPPDARPYRGLEAFREEDAHLFFGRDALAQNVVDKLGHHRLVLLLGASGSGKSSLINAGILPKLRQDQGLTIVRCTPGDRAIANLAAALARAIEPNRSPADLLPAQRTYREQLETDPDAIRDIAQFLPNGRLLLVIDQFEESFTLTRPANPKQHEALIATLLAIARSPDERKLNALLGMRSDFQNELETADPELIQRLDNAMVQMRAMLPAEREAAITEPARVYGVTLEPGLLTAITVDLADNRDALPLLEVALDELWSRRDDTSRRLTLAAFTEIGGIPGALGQRADSALEHLGLDDTLVRRLFLALVRVDPEGASTKSTRRPRTRQTLGEELWQLGERLAAPGLRLLVTYRDDTTGDQLLNVSHEAIFRQWRQIARWIEDERDFLLFIQRLAQRLGDFTGSGENPDYLLTKTDLQTAQAWQSNGKTFDRYQQEYIARSATFWAYEAAENQARALWGRLELLFSNYDFVPKHELSALEFLASCNADFRYRFLNLTINDQHVARKLVRQPELLARATLGVYPNAALEFAGQMLQNLEEHENIELTLAWTAIARIVSPLMPSIIPTMVERAHFVAASTSDKRILELLSRSVDSASQMISSDVNRDIKDFIDQKIRENSDFELKKITRIRHRPTNILTEDGQRLRLNPKSALHTLEKLFNAITNTTDPLRLVALGSFYHSISANIDESIGHHVERLAISALNESHDSFQIKIVAQAVAVTADKLDPTVRRDIIRAIVDRINTIARNAADPRQLPALGEAVDDIASLLSDEQRSDAAGNIVEIVLDFFAGEVSLWGLELNELATTVAPHLEYLCSIRLARIIQRATIVAAEKPNRIIFGVGLIEAIMSMSKKLQPQEAAPVLEIVLNHAGKSNSICAFQMNALAVSNLTLSMDRTPVIFIALEILKYPFGGDEKVTDTLLVTVSRALDRPDLLRPFPEQSFWAVMQHLAELKAANPDWDWLDLARPPLPIDELIATFRDLCANPPDWPATTAPA